MSRLSIPVAVYNADLYFPTVRNPAYNQHSVPLDHSVYSAFAQTFDDKIKMTGQTSAVNCGIEDVNKMPKLEDCSAALATGMRTVSVGALRGRNGRQWWAAVARPSHQPSPFALTSALVRLILRLLDRA